MLLAPIAPVSLCGTVTQMSSYLMTLPEMALASSDYVDLHKTLSINGAFIILDNGLSEYKEPLDVRTLESVIDRMSPSEVVLPDFLEDKERTCRAARANIQELRTWYAGRLMAVPQGTTVQDYLDCIYEFISMKEIGTIGISKYFPEITGEPRRTLLQLVRDRSLHKRRSIDWHLLGLAETPKELSNLALDFPWIRGIDTCYPVLAAMNGMKLSADSEVITSPEGYELSTPWLYWPREGVPVDLLPFYLGHNVEFFTGVCRGSLAI